MPTRALYARYLHVPLLTSLSATDLILNLLDILILPYSTFLYLYFGWLWLQELKTCESYQYKQARKLQDAQAEKLTSLQANKLTS